MRQEYVLYIHLNESGYITDINSTAFMFDTTGWVEIDRGSGFEFANPQNYLPECPVTFGGAYRYKLVDGKPVECTPEEIREQEEALKPVKPTPTLESRVETLETDTADLAEALDMLLSGVTE